VAEALVAALGRGPIEVRPEVNAPREDQLLTPDNSKARMRLGWRPRLDFAATIAPTAARRLRGQALRMTHHAKTSHIGLASRWRIYLRCSTAPCCRSICRDRTGLARDRLCRAPLVENASSSLIGGPGLCQEELGIALLLMLLASGDEVIE
jgi:hypothetical protein